MDYNYIGQPIKSLQTHLRTISAAYPNIPAVVPDGVFDEKTKAAVEAFQIEFNLDKTGEVDLETWEKIIEVKTRVERERGDQNLPNIYPSDNRMIDEGESDEIIYIVQSMLKSLAKVFLNFPDVDITGTNDAKTADSIIEFKKVAGLRPTAQITREFWDILIRIYGTNVSNNAVE